MLLLLPLLLIPLASAQWLVSVSSSPFSAEFFIVADSDGCIYVLDGEVRGVYEFNGDSFVPVGSGNEICIHDASILRFQTTSDVFVQLPPSFVVVENATLSDVSYYDVGNRTFIHASPNLFPVLAAAVLIILLLLVSFLWRNRHNGAGKDIDAEILSYVAEHPGCTQKDICNALGLEKYQVSRILSRLEKEGKIVRVRRGISKRVFLPKQLQ
ncbi:MAG: MarR family [Candidatus Diapherotrites archaeon]|nr:MarR family [Candidatus Diapherotrites archaeon]